MAKKIDKAVFPGSQGGPLQHIIAAKAVCFGEALRPEFKEYQKQVVKNASALAAQLKQNGLNLVSGGTDNHLVLLDLRGSGITGKELEDRLHEIGISANKNAIPFDTEKKTITSGLRLGTPALTTRGMVEKDMVTVANIISDAVFNYDEKKEDLVKQVGILCKTYPLTKILR